MAADRMDAPRCVARAKSTGEQCKRRPIPGGRVCVKHGGGAPAVRAAAARRRAELEARAVIEVVWDPDAPPVRDPIDALMRLAGKLEHSVDVLGTRLESVGAGSPEAVAFTKLIREHRLALEGLERLDIAGKQAQLEQDRAELVIAAFIAALDWLRPLPADRSEVTRLFLENLGAPVVVSGEVEA